VDLKTSRGTEVRKPILLLVLAGVVFICPTIPANATVTPVTTITFNDATDMLSAAISGSGSASASATCGVSSFPVWGGTSLIPFEYCTGSILAPSGTHLDSLASLPLFNFIGGGTAGATVSDSFAYVPVYDRYTGAQTSVKFIFLSDLPNNLGVEGPGVPCALVGGCRVTETGIVQNLGDIKWSDGTVDHITFSSSVAPEPASLMLFGSGLGIAAVFLRRRRRLVTPSV
jgi:hypothetical protein